MHWFLRTNRKAFLSLSAKQAWYSIGRKEFCNKFMMFFTLEQHLKHNDVILAPPKSATKLPSTTVKPALQFYAFLNIADKWMPDLTDLLYLQKCKSSCSVFKKSVWWACTQRASRLLPHRNCWKLLTQPEAWTQPSIHAGCFKITLTWHWQDHKP